VYFHSANNTKKDRSVAAAILTQAIGWDESSPSSPNHFTPRERTPIATGSKCGWHGKVKRSLPAPAAVRQ